jgi:hypothetical protein
MAGDVVEDVWFGQVIHPIHRTDRDRRREFAPVQAVEEQKTGHVATHRFGLKAGQWLEAEVYIGQAGHMVGVELKDIDPTQEMIVSVPFPAGLDPVEEPFPGFMVFLRIKLVWL